MTTSSAVPSDPIFRLSVEQYHEMIRAGILTNDDNVELLEGWLVSKMSKNPPRRVTTELTADALRPIAPPGWYVTTQEPMTTSTSEPEPDVSIVRGRSTVAKPDASRSATSFPSGPQRKVIVPNPMPKAGDDAPNFNLPASTGKTIDLAELTARKRVVLYFYPKADTSGCTVEACAFRDAADDYKKAGVVVLGVSPDPVEKVKKFVDKHHLNFPLLADADHAVCEQYGVWAQKSMYGRKYMGALRTTFVIAKGGKIEHVFEKVKPAGHEAQVLEWIRENGKG